MPELPEVETIRRGLTECITRQAIKRIDVACAKSFQGDPATVTGATITTLRRFGKALVIDLDNQISLMIHLRMTGQLIYDPVSLSAPIAKPTTTIPATPTTPTPTAPTTPTSRYAAGHPSANFTATLPNRQTRVTLALTRGVLYFNDQRKFGFIKPIKTTEVMHDPFIEKLAPDPWHLTPDALYASLARHPHSQIKPTLLDQTIIAGLGNIYVDETLFASRIHPEERCANITRDQAADLIKNAQQIMETSIASGGSTFETYVKPDGTTGDYLDAFAQVFNRTGQPCPVCHTPIQKIKVAGRGTHFCPRCQPLSITRKGTNHD